MRLRELVALCRRELAEGGLSPSPDAEILVSCAAGIPRSRLALEGERDASAAAGPVSLLVRRRLAGEPVQYILGAWDFYGREFRLTRDTLIPRPETEGLVERVIGAWLGEGRDRGTMLDVGAGCGAIGVTLCLELPRVKVVAVDVSAGALAVARDNARAMKAVDRMLFVRADGYSALQRGDRFDVVVANPPYVSEKEWDLLPREVRDFEPAQALLAGADGLDVIRPLVERAWEHLAPRGRLWVEIGETQAVAVRALPCGPLAFAGVARDLAGRDRVACWIR